MPEETVQVWQRRICWPEPDLTCLEGGCSYCNDSPFRDVESVENAVRRGEVKVKNRGNRKAGDAGWSFQFGVRHGFGNAQTRYVERRKR